MHYNSFPDRINVEKTSKQCFQPLLFLENRKGVKKWTETQVQGQIVDEWTVGLEKGGLYNGGESPEEGETKRKRKNVEEDSLC